MKTYALSFVLVVTSMLAVSAHAQIVRDLTPEHIREAIAFGTKNKEVRPYRIQEKAHWTWPPFIAVYQRHSCGLLSPPTQRRGDTSRSRNGT